MKRTVILACATLAFGLIASPLVAQEAAQPAPQAEQLPPPPPFPPMPSSKPSHRFVDMGGHTSRARSKASPARQAASPKRDRKAHSSSTSRTSHKARSSQKARGSKATASHRSVRKDKPVHFSAKTVRSCHAMTYRQIIRNSSCRAMIKQELAAPTPTHRANHKASAHRATHHGTSKTARRHSTAKRRSR
jgi:hypothetical protein